MQQLTQDLGAQAAAASIYCSVSAALLQEGGLLQQLQQLM